MKTVFEAALKKPGTIAVRAFIADGVHIIDAMEGYLSVRDYMNTDEFLDEWPEHDHAVTVDEFFMIEGITQNEAVFSISPAYGEDLNDKTLVYIRHLFRKTMGKLFVPHEIRYEK